MTESEFYSIVSFSVSKVNIRDSRASAEGGIAIEGRSLSAIGQAGKKDVPTPNVGGVYGRQRRSGILSGLWPAKLTAAVGILDAVFGDGVFHCREGRPGLLQAGDQLLQHQHAITSADDMGV